MNYAEIYTCDSINTSEGYNVSVFCVGCLHKCKGCHNYKAQDFDYGKKYTKETEEYIIEHLKKPYISGLSLLGGEPFQNLDGMLPLIKRAKRECPNKKVWVWTGYTLEQLLKNQDKTEMLKYIDIIIDGRFIESLKDLNIRLRGSSNQRVIDVQESLKQNKTVLYLE